MNNYVTNEHNIEFGAACRTSTYISFEARPRGILVIRSLHDEYSDFAINLEFKIKPYPDFHDAPFPMPPNYGEDELAFFLLHVKR